MKHQAISQPQFTDIDGISRLCGDVTVGCSDVAGVVQRVIDSFGKLHREHESLKTTVNELEEDQKLVTDACDESRLLSERALERLEAGRSHIGASLSQISNLLEAVQALTMHVTGFAAAMEQVKRTSQEIEEIADNTNILALNATIEAHRAGEAGRTFSIVANEVKSLAGDAHRASKEITRTIEALEGEAEQVIAKISSGAEDSAAARKQVSQIEQTINEVCDLIGEVDGQNDQIVRNSSKIGEHVHKVQGVLGGFSNVVFDNEEHLQKAHDRIESLEMTASGMFDALVKAGLSPVDSAMVEKAQANAIEIISATEKAIANGEISPAALFDTDYREIPGSNPKRYRTALNDWADKVWQPMLDRFAAADGRVVASACTDMNGFLPTHLSKHSKKPTGDVAYDTEHCRNGRMMLGPIDQHAKLSADPYMMAVYRHEGDGKAYRVVRNVYVPITIDGRRWGDLELAYCLE
ncbi:methyl-accepting chemotaxis protein [Aurantiacibacter sp. MUD11]|uniref:methyl-accepting chemotaxis protein n=1 Tax=Aurantiacibacter sp. MUD11 TaxID=3003265 RepID=UPI0022AA41EF|nr:methyl-accepting chemotaxis protein [Aurantiacibacter sp. MUD11]WAT18383.1 methyl-accepting chemotaxis protein [Aurantiacibacter sp. MUD11]